MNRSKKNIRNPKDGNEAVEFAIRTQNILADLVKNKGNVEYCSEIIRTLNEQEAKGVLKHYFYRN